MAVSLLTYLNFSSDKIIAINKIFVASVVTFFLMVSGCKKSDTPTPKPVANFNFASANFGLLPTTVNFSDSSQNAESYQWYFGDGNTSTSKNPSNTYSVAKTYSVKLVVTNSSGADSITRQVVISLNKPKANFTFNSSNMGQQPTTMSFTNASIGAITYQWYFDNGDTSSKTNPSENYSITKTYNVKLVAVNAAGKDSVTKQVQVTINKSSAKQMLSFIFLKSQNPTLISDITGTINGNKISVNMFSGFSKSLVATFSSSPKSSVYVGTNVQQSGLTVNDFSYTVDYTVKAEDSSTFTYSVDIQRDSFPQLDNAIVPLMSKYNMPGLSLAILKDDKLVYLNSYGFADIENNQSVTNKNLFRIGSISKNITAVSILKLAELGSLSLSQTVFGSGGILGNDYGTPPSGSGINLITIQNLLDHKSGWAYDPYGEPYGWTSAQMIKDLVTDSALRYNPGDTSIYLNAGYVILARVIEKVTNKGYEDYVKSNILAPCNVSRMAIGGSTLAERLPDEVKYYNAMYSPYTSTELRKWDAAGGWIASALDMARYVSRIDRLTYRPDILNSNSLQQMFFWYYTWINIGGIQGTNAILTRLDDHFSYAVVINHDIGSAGLTELINLMSNTIQARSNWATYDLF
jgi:CubicO group peptidase (beta-lactamase class C family)/IMP cyclohydrolase